MVLDYYKLSEQPFGVTPDSRFLYLGPKHREALASLVYGTETNRGFLTLVAKPGMGKTTLLHHYLGYLRDKARTAFLFRTDCDSREFMRHLLLDLGVDVAGMDLPAMHESLNRILLREAQDGRRFVLVIDEAQDLEEKVLESIRLLSNFETPSAKLMQIVLAGQPQLADRLANPLMAQFRQRVSMVIRIEPFTHEEVNAYIDHRLRVAGCADASLFTVGARKLIAEHSEGIPRNINNLCFNSMSLACALERKTIGRDIVQEVIVDLDLEPLRESNRNGADRNSERPAPSFPARINVSSLFTGWLAKLAVMTMVLLALGWFAVRADRNERSTNLQAGERVSSGVEASGTANAKAISKRVPSAVASPTDGAVRKVDLAPTLSAEQATAKVDQPWEVVKVKHGQTLYEISLKRFGKYDDTVVEQLRAKNPWLNNPNLIITGQRLLMPPQARSSTTPQRTSEAALNASLPKAGQR